MVTSKGPAVVTAGTQTSFTATVVGQPANPNLSVPIGQLAAFSEELDRAVILRSRGSRYVSVQLTVTGRTVEALLGEARSVLAAAIKLPAGYSLESFAN